MVMLVGVPMVSAVVTKTSQLNVTADCEAIEGGVATTFVGNADAQNAVTGDIQETGGNPTARGRADCIFHDWSANIINGSTTNITKMVWYTRWGQEDQQDWNVLWYNHSNASYGERTTVLDSAVTNNATITSASTGGFSDYLNSTGGNPSNLPQLRLVDNLVYINEADTSRDTVTFDVFVINVTYDQPDPPASDTDVPYFPQFHHNVSIAVRNGSSVNFFGNATDDTSNVDQFNGTINGVVRQFTLFNGTAQAGFWNYSFECLVSDDLINWTLANASDINGNTNSTNVTHVGGGSVNMTCDAGKPTPSGATFNTTLVEDDINFCVGATITDAESRLDTATLNAQLQRPGTGLSNFSMSDTACGDTASNNIFNVSVNPSPTETGVWNLSRIFANDTVDNANHTNFTGSITVVGADIPFLGQFQVNNSFLRNGTFANFFGNATDNGTISSFNGTVNGVTSVFTLFNGTTNSGFWNFSYACVASDDLVNWTLANGSDQFKKTNTTNVTTGGGLSVNVTCDAGRPVPSNNNFNETSIVDTQDFCVGATITDPELRLDTSTLRAQVQRPGTGLFNYTLSDTGCGDPAGNDVFNVSINPTSSESGAWNLSRVYANDTYDNANHTNFTGTLSVSEGEVPRLYQFQVNQSLLRNGTFANFFGNGTDNVAIASYNGTINGLTQTFTLFNGTTTSGFWNYSFACVVSDDLVNWTIANASDTSGNTNSTNVTAIGGGSVNLTCDAGQPSISAEAVNDTAVTNIQEFCVGATITDPELRLDTSALFATFQQPGVGLANFTLSDTGCSDPAANDVYNFSISSPVIGVWNLTNVFANDTPDNMNFTNVTGQSVTVTDGVKPFFGQFHHNVSIAVRNGSSVNFFGNATDEHGSIDQFNGSINGITRTFSLFNGTTTSGFWNFSFACVVSDDLINWTLANTSDVQGNFNSTNVTHVGGGSVNMTCDAGQPVSTSPNVNNSAVDTSQDFCVGASITDAEGRLDTSALFATFQQPTVGLANFSLSDTACGDPASNGIFNASISPAQIGVWNLTNIFANDTVDNMNQSNVSGVSVTVTSADNVGPFFPSFTRNVSVAIRNGSFINFSMNVTDLISDIAATNGTIGGVVYTFTQYSGTSQSGNFSVALGCTVSQTLNWTLANASDSLGNANSTNVTLDGGGSANFTCDAGQPVVSALAVNVSSIGDDEDFCAGASISDPEGRLDTATLIAQIREPTGVGFVNYTLTDTGCGDPASNGVFNVSITNLRRGVWNLTRVFANDTPDNMNFTNATDQSVDVLETDLPFFNDTAINASFIRNGTFGAWYINVSDNSSNINAVNGTINGSIVLFTFFNGSLQNGGNWRGIFECTQTGNLTFNFSQATDIHNNFNQTNVTAPSIDCEASLPDVITQGSNISNVSGSNVSSCFNVTVVDASNNLDAIIGEIFRPDIDNNNYTMTDTACGDPAGNDRFAANVTIDQVGTYNFTSVFANDTRGNIRIVSITNVSINANGSVAEEPPAPPATGGGPAWNLSVVLFIIFLTFTLLFISSRIET